MALISYDDIRANMTAAYNELVDTVDDLDYRDTEKLSELQKDKLYMLLEDIRSAARSIEELLADE